MDACPGLIEKEKERLAKSKSPSFYDSKGCSGKGECDDRLVRRFGSCGKSTGRYVYCVCLSSELCSLKCDRPTKVEEDS